MPRKIHITWIICCAIILLGFIYFSMQLQMKEMEVKRQEKIAQDQALAKRNKAKAAQVNKAGEIIRNIKEMNALGNHVQAASIAELAIQDDLENAMIYTWWGISLVKAGQPGKAMGKFVQSARLDPNDPKTYLYWGLTLAMEKNFEEAVEKYRISVELDPDSNNALGYWGAALEQLGEYDQAIEKMEKAMAINSFNELIYGVLVDSRSHKGEYQKAWEIVFRARNVQINIADKSLKRLAEAMPEPK